MFSSLLVFVLFAVLGGTVAFGLMQSNAAAGTLHGASNRAGHGSGPGMGQRPDVVPARHDDPRAPTTPLQG